MKTKWVLCGLMGLAALSLAVPGNAQKQGKTRPLTTSQMMAGFVKPQFAALKEGLEKGPATDEEWAALATQAALLNESGYMMMADDRCPDAIWSDSCALMRDGGVQVLQQIKERNAAAALEAFNNGIAASCKKCHAEHKYKKQ